MRSSTRLATLGLLLSACGSAEPTLDLPGDELASCQTSTTPLGVDVSHFDGTISWPTVKSSGISFGIAKATEGLTIQDSEFAANWAGMTQAGVVRGAYHFFHPADNGTQQADAFLAMTGALGRGDLPPFLDWEVIDSSSVATSITEAQRFIDEIALKTGLTTVIYTYPSFWTSTLGSPAQFGAYPLWYASYVSTCPSIPAPWTSWLFWQNSASGTVPGIPATGTPAAVDLDVFNGTLQDLLALAGDGGAVSPPPDAGSPDAGSPDAGSPIDAGPTLLAQVSGNDALTVVNWPDAHMELFAKTPSGAEMHAATTGTGDSWSALAQLDTGAQCGSAAAFWGAPWVYPELFSPLIAGSTAHLWWTAGTGWNIFHALTGGSNLTHLSTLTWADGHVSVYALGTDGTIWQNAWSTTASNWTGWSSLGGTNLVTGAGTLMKTENVGELFATDSSGAVWHTYSGTGASYPNGWHAWVELGGAILASRPFPVRWADDHVSVYARGADHLLYFADFSSSTPAFAAVDPHTKVAGDPSAFITLDGPTIVTRLLSGQVVQSTWTGSGYSPLAPVGLQIAASDPFAWLRGDGDGEVFAVDPTGAVLHTLHGASGWASWSSLGTGIDPCSSVVLQPDAGLFDAGMRVPDAGGSPEADGGFSNPDGGPVIRYYPGQGCGCASVTGSPTVALLGLALAATWRRRRGSRRPSPRAR